jgi:dethiobiotin synthetase
MDSGLRGLFITATDTGAGKTFVTAAVARIWRRQQRSFRVCKPVATGAESDWSEDTCLLADAAGETDLRAVTPFTFAVPAAPPVAARLARTTLTLKEVSSAVRRLGTGGKAVLVEGVGGVLCPLTERETVADLAVELGLPLIVVARRGLGTLNHTLLTVEAAERRGLRVAGVVVTETTPVRSVAEETNVEELRRRLDVPLLAVVAHQSDAACGAIPALDAVDWWRLTA